MAKKTTDSIRKLLRKNGPLDSQALAAAAVAAGVSSSIDAARKAIERSKKAKLINSTYPVRFDRSFLYYLDSHKGRRYATAVRQSLKKKPSQLRVFKTLLANKGWITYGQVGKVSACLPADATTRPGGRKTVDEVVAELRHLRVLDDVAGTPHLYRLGTQFGAVELSRGAFLHRLAIEQELLHRARDWLRNSYLLSYNKHTCRDSTTEAVGFNQVLWDMHGPSYVGPSSRDPAFRRLAAKENFLVAEILAYRSFGSVDAEATIERCESITRRWDSIALTPVVISRSFSQPAWNALRQRGIAAVLLSDVLGRNIDSLLRAMWDTLSEATSPAKHLRNLKDSLAIAEGTVDNDGLIGNLKGTLFEFLIALAWRMDGYNTTLQKAIRNSVGDEFEIDVVAIRGKTCRLIECKGRHAAYREGKAELARHFEDRCEAAADVYGWNVTEHYQTVEAVFVTSGRLDDDAKAYAKSVKKSHGIRCRVITRKELLTWFDSFEEDHLRKIVDRYYKHKPLAAEEDIDS